MISNMPKLFIAICAVALMGAGCGVGRENLKIMVDECVKHDGFPHIVNDGHGDYLKACIFYPSTTSTK